MRDTVLAVMVASVFLGGCAGPMTVGCGPGGSPGVVAEVVFGRNIGDALGVSDADWNRFLDEEVTPRFPDGLTVLDAGGQWRDTERGTVVREPSKVVVIVLLDEVLDRPRIGQIAEAYKTKFKQQAVLTMLRPACVSF
ncbi:hypothetical protein N825_22130 [Skermanella stibiiresistens SB22]|uniref:DUF3574 domain-containing protein n=1 Tax=Skermanella stibiiresistens SB22 TaxID=1385369 RepID=W9GSY8_9PROT|nr:DUF3574 domain-containing protein [Skermanella stibiiresistens]EWY37010.1 hypothetical protein N825_22130 [Skermanella stibiiresistens SB22]